MAEFLTKPVDVDEVLARRPHNRNGPGLSYLDIPTVNFSGDILILLSLLSPETAAKVDRYRAEMRDAGAINRYAEEGVGATPPRVESVAGCRVPTK